MIWWRHRIVCHPIIKSLCACLLCLRSQWSLNYMIFDTKGLLFQRFVQYVHNSKVLTPRRHYTNIQMQKLFVDLWVCSAKGAEFNYKFLKTDHSTVIIHNGWHVMVDHWSSGFEVWWRHNSEVDNNLYLCLNKQTARFWCQFVNNLVHQLLYDV